MSEKPRGSNRGSYMIVEEWFLLVYHVPTPTPIATAAIVTNATILRIHQITGLEAARSVGCFKDFSMLMVTLGNEFL